LRMSITPIPCAGDSFELGRAQGAAVADRVRGCLVSLRELEAVQLMRPRWMPHAVFLRIAERRANRCFARSVASAGVPERVDGIAAGAGVRRTAVRLLNLLEPMLSDIVAQTHVPPLGGCSAVAVGVTTSAVGEPMLARNFDYLPLVQPFYVMRDTQPRDGLRSLDFTLAPLAGTPDGINEAGLCITCNYAYVTDPGGHAAPISMAIAEALRQCSTVVEAAELLSRCPRWGGGLVMLADASGDLASLEISNGRTRLRRPEGGADVLFHTNCFHTDAMREVELSRDAAFSEWAPEPLRGKLVHDSAQRRDARFAQLLADAGSIGPEELLAVMADHGPEGAASDSTPCMHGAYWHTTATLQFFPRSRRVRVAFDTACRATFTELEVGGGVVVPA